MILGVRPHQADFELIPINMSGYGYTEVAKGVDYSYDDWVKIAVNFIDLEL